MAPTPQNNTARIFVDYITGNAATSIEHTMTARYNPSVTTPVNVMGFVASFLSAIGAAKLATGWRVLRCRQSNAGAVFSLPISVAGGLAAIVGSAGSLTPSNEAREFTWVGRSLTTGKAGQVVLYGITEALSDNFRYPSGGTSPAWIANTVANLNTSGTGTWITVDNTPAQWYSYVNVNFNSYWENRIRNV